MASSRSSSARRGSSAGRPSKKRSTRKRSSSSHAGGARKATGSRKYGEAASKKVGRALHEAKRGTLRSGRSKKKVTSRKQAIAIGLSEARRRGAKVPRRSRSK